jgi:hypothetical protein
VRLSPSVHSSIIATPHSSSPEQTKIEKGVPWHKAYPSPKASASTISPSDLLQWMLDGTIAEKEFVLSDLRRKDHKGGTIKVFLNLPAQSLYPSIHMLYDLFSCSGSETCSLVLL